MVVNSTFLVLVGVLGIVSCVIIYLTNMKKKGELYKHFFVFTVLLTLPLIGLSLQILFSKTGIPPIYFDYITYIFTMYAPIELLFIALLFYNPDVKIKKLKNFYIIPVILLLALWTNDLHHLFYKVYSINFSESEFGIFFYITTFFCYITLLIDMIILFVATIRRSGFFSKQSILIVLGILVPLIGNLLGVIQIVPMNIYMTPILFSVTSICFSLAIFKYKALNITPIAFRTVIDTMSDAFIVISDDGTVVDSNKTFQVIFDKYIDYKRDSNLFDAVEENKIIDIKELKKNILETRVKDRYCYKRA
ncbi:MAG: histidine kinase N-terminal 7TM domain-containing protein [Clostridia bacterium]